MAEYYVFDEGFIYGDETVPVDSIRPLPDLAAILRNLTISMTPIPVYPYEVTQEQQDHWEKVKREQQEAEARSRELFLSLLTDGQKVTLESDRFIDIQGSKGNTYRIHCVYTSDNVYLRINRQSVQRYCAGPVGVPTWDYWLGQKLLLEADEGHFMEFANIS